MGVKGRLRRSVWYPTYPPRRLKDFLSSDVRPSSVALTFDDGPDPRCTPELLDLLEAHGVTATFFVCGLAVERFPELLRRIAERGHVIGNHTWDHRSLRGTTEREWRDQIDATSAVITSVAGIEPRLFRPPRGVFDRQILPWLLNRGLTPVLWSSHASDWSERDPDRIAERTVRALEDQGIVLLHDGSGDFLAPDISPPPQVHGNPRLTLQAMPMILDGIRQSGLKTQALPQPDPELARRLRTRARFVP